MSKNESVLDELLRKNVTELTSGDVPIASSGVPHEAVLAGGFILFLVISVLSVYFVVRVCFRRPDDESSEMPQHEVDVGTTATETTNLVEGLPTTSASRTRFLEKRRQAVQQGKKTYGSVDT